MRFRFALLLTLALPFAAAGQALGVRAAQDFPGLSAPDAGVPVWQDGSDNWLALKTDRQSAAEAMRRQAPRIIDARVTGSAGLLYSLGPQLKAHADLNEYSWVGARGRVLGGEVGASYDLGRYSVGMSLGSSSVEDRGTSLPRVLPGVAPGVDGFSAFDTSAQLSAYGRLALGARSGVDVGASVGRIHLLPGNLLGISTVDQKALSFGVEHGPLSGVLTGRTMQPLAGVPGNANADRRWNSIDLGVTWRLPWRGALSIGAQNLWSSGSPANTPTGPEPDQSRTPYVQYHQDL